MIYTGLTSVTRSDSRTCGRNRAEGPGSGASRRAGSSASCDHHLLRKRPTDEAGDPTDVLKASKYARPPKQTSKVGELRSAIADGSMTEADVLRRDRRGRPLQARPRGQGTRRRRPDGHRAQDAAIGRRVGQAGQLEESLESVVFHSPLLRKLCPLFVRMRAVFDSQFDAPRRSPPRQKKPSGSVLPFVCARNRASTRRQISFLVCVAAKRARFCNTRMDPASEDLTSANRELRSDGTLLFVALLTCTRELSTTLPQASNMMLARLSRTIAQRAAADGAHVRCARAEDVRLRHDCEELVRGRPHLRPRRGCVLQARGGQGRRADAHAHYH